MSENLIRFGISLPENLSRRFDQLIARRQYASRSEALRDLIRKTLIEDEIASDAETLGVLHLLYDHHKHELSDKLTTVQHDHHEMIISSTHVHLDHHNCLEVILLKGKASEIQQIADSLIAEKGVQNGKLYLTAKGE